MSDFKYLEYLNNIYDGSEEFNLIENSHYNFNNAHSLKPIHYSLNLMYGFGITSQYLSSYNYNDRVKANERDGLIDDLKSKIIDLFELSEDTKIEDPMKFLKTYFESGINNEKVFNPSKITRAFKYAYENITNNFKNVTKTISNPVSTVLRNYSSFCEMLRDEYEIDIDIGANTYQIEKYLKNLSFLDNMNSVKDEYNAFISDLSNIKRIHTKSSEGLSVDDIEYYKSLCKNVLLNFENSIIVENKEFLANFSVLCDYANIQTYLNYIEDEFDVIHEKLHKAGVYFSQAEEYIANLPEQSELTTFIKNKKQDSIHNDPSIEYTIKTPQATKYKNAIFFEDESFILEDKEGNLKTYLNDFKARTAIKEYMNDYINFKLRKHPTINKSFNDKNFKGKRDYLGMFKAIETYLENESILKANNFKINELIAKNSMERLDDLMNFCINDHQLKQYAHSIASNKYKELYNEKTYEIIKELKDFNIPESHLQDSIGKKIAAYKTPEAFNDALISYLNSFNHFSEEQILIKSSLINSKCIIADYNVVVLKIENFEQSSKLGSSSWCISRDEHYFESYTDNGSNQYFIYDFNHASTDNNSMVGLTLYKDGTYHTAHLKNDSSYKLDDELKSLMLKIIENDLDSYPMLDKSIKDKLKTIEAIKPNKEGTKTEFRI